LSELLTRISPGFGSEEMQMAVDARRAIENPAGILDRMLRSPIERTQLRLIGTVADMVLCAAAVESW